MGPEPGEEEEVTTATALSFRLNPCRSTFQSSSDPDSRGARDHGQQRHPKSKDLPSESARDLDGETAVGRAVGHAGTDALAALALTRGLRPFGDVKGALDATTCARADKILCLFRTCSQTTRSFHHTKSAKRVILAQYSFAPFKESACIFAPQDAKATGCFRIFALFLW